MIAVFEGDVYKEPVTFVVKEAVSTETIVPNASLQDMEVSFMKGATLEGYPANVNLFDPATGNVIGQREGLLLDSGDGHVIIPFDSLEEVSDEGLEIVEEIKEKGKSFLPEDGLFGFSYKQLLFIGALTLIVSSIVKK